MSTIAAFSDGNDVHMASDRGHTVGGTVVSNSLRKIMAWDDGYKGKILLGIAGNSSCIQHTYRMFEPPLPDPGILAGPYMKMGALDDWASDFAASWTEILAEMHPTVLASTEDGDVVNASGLLAVGRFIWHLGTNVALPIQNFHAVGSGADFAKGHMHSSLYYGHRGGAHFSKNVAAHAVLATRDFDPYTNSDIYCQSTTEDRKVETEV